VAERRERAIERTLRRNPNDYCKCPPRECQLAESKRIEGSSISDGLAVTHECLSAYPTLAGFFGLYQMACIIFPASFFFIRRYILDHVCSMRLEGIPGNCHGLPFSQTHLLATSVPSSSSRGFGKDEHSFNPLSFAEFPGSWRTPDLQNIVESVARGLTASWRMKSLRL